MLWLLDSSALVKRYVREPGSAWLRTELTKRDLLIAQLTSVEITAAICKRHRTGDISRFTHYQAYKQVLKDLTAHVYTIIALSDDIIRLAQSLTFTRNLRAYDAVQLATALNASRRMRAKQFSFITADIKLEAAARAEGLQTDNPLSH
jgi:predicted nucleic acid-binding protein